MDTFTGFDTVELIYVGLFKHINIYASVWIITRLAIKILVREFDDLIFAPLIY